MVKKLNAMFEKSARPTFLLVHDTHQDDGRPMAPFFAKSMGFIDTDPPMGFFAAELR